MKTTSKINNLKNEDDLKDEDNLKNEQTSKMRTTSKMKTTPIPIPVSVLVKIFEQYLYES